ncbi:MAG: branched-chain amino acid ABC transporter permease [Acidimicrobiia bacterium]
MTRFLQISWSGLTSGSIVALLAFGWVVVYRVSGVLNLAQGTFMVVGALSFTSLAGEHGAPLVVAGLVGFAASVGLAVLLDLLALRPARPGGSPAQAIIITLGCAMVLDEVSRHVWGNDPLRQAPFLDTTPLDVWGVRVQQHALLLVAGTLVLLGAMWFVFDRTLVGKALEACSESAEGASLVGINPRLMRTVAFAVAGGTGAVAGILLVPTVAIGWDSGLLLGIKGFIAAVLGSWGYPGAVAAAVLLGLSENYAAGYLSSAWKDAVTLVVLLVVLLVRPQGIIPRRGARPAPAPAPASTEAGPVTATGGP